MNPPWASGPGEILKHGLDLLKHDSDVNRRLAMISIDNSVELMINTYLSLPSRVTGLKISRKILEEIQQSFPKLLDALEEMAHEKCKGLNLGHIEWYHRIRNQLYHEGNGITVEREKVEIYSELAKELFNNLFGYRVYESKDEVNSLLMDYIRAAQAVDKSLDKASDYLINVDIDITGYEAIAFLNKKKIISDLEFSDFKKLMNTRNDVIHNKINYKDVINKKVIAQMSLLPKKIDEWLDSYLDVTAISI
jgi:hypothetical protein